MRDSAAVPTWPRDIGRFAGWSAGGFVVLVPAGLVLLGLLAAGPVGAADRWVADGVNALVAPHPTLVGVLVVATSLGATPTAAVVLGTLVAVLLIRRRARLAVYVAVTAIGGAALSPTLKVLVGRLRPVVPEPVAGAGGYSFPSGHATTVTIMVGVSLLVLLPAVPARWQRALMLAGICVAVLVGLTRVALGVHFVSDVVAGWLLGSAWVALTATAFRRWCTADRSPLLLVQGLEPAAGPDLEPAPEHQPPASPWLRASWLLVGGVLVLAVLLGAGWMITRIAPGTQAEAGDLGVVRWLAAHRTAGLDVVSAWAADLGATIPVFVLGLVAATLTLAALRRWWPVVLLAVGLVGELVLFLTTAVTIDRPRPPVSHLDAALPPTSSFPSGHTGAAICLYGGVALIIFVSTRSWWRWVAVAVAFALVVTIALARLYRGAHFLTDVLGSVLLAVPWLLMVASVVRPPQSSRDRQNSAPAPTETTPLRPTSRR
jgi:membrane-associated phospholipid phosphatase